MKSTFLPGPFRPVKPKAPYRHAPATGQRRHLFADCVIGDYILDGEADPHQPKPEEGIKFEGLTWMSNGYRTVRAWTRTA